jgi:hypothetical protein
MAECKARQSFTLPLQGKSDEAEKDQHNQEALAQQLKIAPAADNHESKPCTSLKTHSHSLKML